MTQRFLRTIITAFLLWVLKCAYGFVVSPWVTPVEDNRPSYSASTGIGQNSSSDTQTEVTSGQPNQRRDLLGVAAEYLPHAPWTAQARYAVRSSGSYVFAEEWDKEENSNRVRFEPFAMVWRSPDSKPTDQPLTIVCDSAVLEFAERFDIRNPKPGRVIGGSLQGPVLIRGSGGLAVNTRNVTFSEAAQRAWSDHEVEFAFGPNHGRAQGLELDLIKQVGPPDDDKPAISGIRTLRLVRDVQFSLQPGAIDRRDKSSLKASTSNDERRSPVKITCDGSFEYKLEVQMAVFHKNVAVVQPTGDNLTNRLNTETLSLEFVRESEIADESTTNRTEGDDAPVAAKLSELKFRWLRASGVGTIVRSDRAELKAIMDELIYDEPAHSVTLRGGRPVRIEQRNHRLQSSEIVAQLDEHNEIVSASCNGTGRLVRYAGKLPQVEGDPIPRIDFAAKWEGALRLEPQENQAGNAIDLEKRVVLTRPGGLRLAAERVRIWLSDDGTAETPDDQPRRQKLGENDRTRPERMLALRQVELKSPQMVGATERLEIWFEDGTLGPPPNEEQEVSSRGARTKRQLQRTAARHETTPSLGAVNQAQYIVKGTRSGRGNSPGGVQQAEIEIPANTGDEVQERAGSTSKKKGAPPVLISADVIRAQMFLSKEEAELSRIRTEGHVHVTQNHGAGVVPLDVKGEQLQLWNYTEDRQILRVQGKPAHVHDRGLQLEGDDIRFDRGANRASVKGKGVLRLPVRNGLDGKPLQEAQLADIFWKEKMEFDGETARFYANVRTQLEGTELACEEMAVKLSHRVSFVADSADSEPELERVICRDGVTIKSSEYKDNKLQSIRIANGHEFTFEQKTGDILGDGPGIVTFWTRNPDRAKKKSGTAANKTAITSRESPWTYTKVTFSGKMKGNAEKRRSQFNDRVAIVFGPVNSPSEVIDIDRMPFQSGWLKCEELVVSQVVAKKTGEEHVTILGKGNAEIEGRMQQGYFSALAYSVSFDQSKGMYVLTGDGRRDAELSRESRPGVANPAVQKAKRFEFFPDRNEINVIEASSASGGT